MAYQDLNAAAVDRWVEEGWEWGRPIDHETFLRARQGDWSVFVPELPKSNPDPNLVQLQLRVAADASGAAAWTVTFALPKPADGEGTH